MIFIDFLLGGLLLYGLIRGLWNGFFIELASLLSLLIGIWAAIHFSHLFKTIIESHVSWSPNTIQIVAFALMFILVLVGISLLAKIFTKLASFAGLGLFNKLLGGLFGVLKMTLIISVSLNLFTKFNGDGRFISNETTQSSLFYVPMLQTAVLIYPSIEEWFAEIKAKAF